MKYYDVIVDENVVDEDFENVKEERDARVCEREREREREK